MKKLIMGAILGLSLIAGQNTANAVEFNAQGEWYFGFGGVDSTLLKNNNGDNDTFKAQQRLRLYLDATVSETLSATISFQIGDTTWGNNDSGGALGTDGAIVGVRDAYLDWILPNSKLLFRMGLQGVTLPNAAGGSAVLDDQVAALVASYQANDNFGVTAFWLRPFNDNYVNDPAIPSVKNPDGDSDNYLDNVDYFGISAPIVINNMEITPWVMVGIAGNNAYDALGSFSMPLSYHTGNTRDSSLNASRAYAMQYYVGVPFIFTADSLNIELDLNYAYFEGIGKYTVTDRRGNVRRADTKRQGWLIKSLVEYRLEWGTPGVLAWYASGDDGNVKNGSERMPAISPSSNFTSFMQDGDGYSVDGGYDLMLSYGGTWGLGLQLKDLSFMNNVSHTLRAVYWGGTNSTDAIKNTQTTSDWSNGEGIYLTTSDHLIEFNIDTSINIYDNLTAIIELGYIINGIDESAWKKGLAGADRKLQTQDAYKAALLMKYEF